MLNHYSEGLSLRLEFKFNNSNNQVKGIFQAIKFQYCFVQVLRMCRVESVSKVLLGSVKGVS